MSTQGPFPGHDNPPHLAAPAPYPDEAVVAGPDTTAGGTAPFLGERTSPPDAPSGIRVKVRVDAQGVHYYVHDPNTGLRFDISDDEDVPLDTPHYAPHGPVPTGVYHHPNSAVSNPLAKTGTPVSRSMPSSTSDMQFTRSPGSTPAQGEMVLDALLTDLQVRLSPEQLAKYTAVKGMLSTGRTALLTTTAFVAGQRVTLDGNARALEQVREDTEIKLQELHQRIASQEEEVETTLNENLRVLWSFGATEAQLAELTKSLAEYGPRQSPRPTLAALSRPETHSAASTDEFQGEMDRELPPRRANESGDAYFRRGSSTVLRKERTAQSFAVSLGASAPISGPPARFVRTARFDDLGSISTAQARQYRDYDSAPLGGVTANASAFSTAHDTQALEADTFHQDQERTIRRIAHREIGEVLHLPPHIKIPKTDAPPKFRGEDDLDIFMKFIELHCTWLRSQVLCGYDPGVDKYRLTMLKGHLDGAALEWYIQTVNSAHYTQQRELTFTDALCACALHRRFITSANAQRATSAFDAVRYDNSTGPDAFAEQLLKRANLMHHVPDEFAVNQKFLAGLPQTIRYKLRVDRELSAEYSPFGTLRSHACQLWNALNSEDAPSAPSCTPAAVPRSSKPTLSAIPAPRRAGAFALTHTRPATSATAPTLHSSGEDTRTCFKCGGIGHIGSNPICPRYRDAASLGARVGAQRVLESYADGDTPGDEYAGPEVAPADDEEAMAGLWGGAQYDPDYDPHVAPDLEDLMNAVDVEEEPVRVGALRARYFSMQITEPADDAEDPDPETPAESAAVPPSPGLLDLDRFKLTFCVATNREWTAEDEALQSLATAAHAPPSSPPAPPFTVLLAEFEARAGSTPLTMAQTLELESIDAVGAEEHARTIWHRLISLHPPLRLGHRQYPPEPARPPGLAGSSTGVPRGDRPHGRATI
ncbi:hypothetical protein DFH09DRAFT_1418473 [Mycena vulgaris]|nr:hypothetical protein DFH09DRAFT_1418473 [Mycena vulgaris]